MKGIYSGRFGCYAGKGYYATSQSVCVFVYFSKLDKSNTNKTHVTIAIIVVTIWSRI